MTNTEAIPILTIGYGSRSVDEFVAVLKNYGVEYLVDVRSAPYSRFKPEFSKDALERELNAHGLRYLYMGDVLGGRPQDPTCYVDDKVDYESVKSREWYLEGIQRIEAAFKQQRHVVLMCSEGKPEQCHRSKLLAASLVEIDVAVFHIDERDELKSQEEIMHTLTGGQLHLFGEPPLTSRKRYSGASQNQSQDEDMEEGL